MPPIAFTINTGTKPPARTAPAVPTGRTRAGRRARRDHAEAGQEPRCHQELEDERPGIHRELVAREEVPELGARHGGGDRGLEEIVDAGGDDGGDERRRAGMRLECTDRGPIAIWLRRLGSRARVPARREERPHEYVSSADAAKERGPAEDECPRRRDREHRAGQPDPIVAPARHAGAQGTRTRASRSRRRRGLPRAARTGA